MFPLNDFNFVCCALATFSAAVGYGVSRRRRSVSVQRSVDGKADIDQKREGSVGMFMFSSTESDSTDPPSSDCPTPSDNAADDTEPGSLKRKHRDETPLADRAEEDVQAAVAVDVTPPRKRCRTPPTIENAGGMEEHVAPAIEAEISESSIPTVIAINEDTVMSTAQCDEAYKVAEPSPPPKDTLVKSPVVFKPTPFGLPTTSIPAAKSSSAFQAFSGSQSAFALTHTEFPSSSRAVWSSFPSDTPLLCSVGEAESSAVCHTSDTAAEDAKVGSSSGSPLKGWAQRQDPLAAHVCEKSTFNAVTGEEDEETRAELKGAKLFIKRGTHEFTNGMLGHIKVLAKRGSSDERILFRREPVWKVSMNVKMCSEVRCTLDEEQGVLRVTLKETLEQEDVPREQRTPQVVVYALKKGKASKADFLHFARSVMDESRTPSEPPTKETEQV